MTTKKVADLEEDYSPDMLPVEKLIFLLLFIVAVIFILALLFGR